MEKPPLTFRDVYDRLTLHVAEESPRGTPTLRKLLLDMEDSFPADPQKAEQATQYARGNIDLTADEAMDLRPWVRPQDALAFCRRAWIDVRTDIAKWVEQLPIPGLYQACPSVFLRMQGAILRDRRARLLLHTLMRAEASKDRASFASALQSFLGAPDGNPYG